MRARLYPVSSSFLALLALVASACSTPDDKPKTEDEFCQDYAKRECANVGAWCAFATMDACHATRAAICRDRGAMWKTGSRSFRPNQIKACLEKVTSVYASLPISYDNLRALEDTCARVYQGSVKLNGNCVITYECEGDLVCDKGACGVKKVVAAGGGCANVGEACVSGYACKASQGRQLCEKRQDVGMACGSADPCLEALRCTGSCVPRLKLSSPCTQHDDCELPHGFCEPYAKICTAGLIFAPGTESCRAFMGATAS